MLRAAGSYLTGAVNSSSSVSSGDASREDSKADVMSRGSRRSSMSLIAKKAS